MLQYEQVKPTLVPPAPLAREYMLDQRGQTYTRWVMFAFGARSGEGLQVSLDKENPDTEQLCNPLRTNPGGQLVEFEQLNSNNYYNYQDKTVKKDFRYLSKYYYLLILVPFLLSLYLTY